MEPDLANKAYEERRQKRQEVGESSGQPQSNRDAIFETAAEAVQQQAEIDRAVNKPRGPIGALFMGVGHVLGTTPVGKYFKAAHQTWKYAEETKRVANARKETVERVIEIGILGGAGWAFTAYKNLQILTTPLFTLVNSAAKLMGHKGSLIAIKAIKIDNALFYGVCVHSQHSLLFGFILTAISYVVLWRLIRLGMRTVKYVLSLV